MNTAKIYSSAIGKGISIDGSPEESIIPELHNADDLPKENEDAARKQLKHQWLASTVTQEFLSNKNKEYESLIDQALSYACGFHSHQNYYQIISILIRANEIRKLIREQQNNK